MVGGREGRKRAEWWERVGARHGWDKGWAVGEGGKRDKR